MLTRQKEIRDELVLIEQRVKEIDVQVAQLKREKVEKIHVLEEKSKAILAEMKK